MTSREEFLEILRILSEESPQPAGKKPPSAEKDHTSDADSDKSDKQGSDKQRRGTGA
jgi:hypothetical protein